MEAAIASRGGMGVVTVEQFPGWESATGQQLERRSTRKV